MFEDPMDDDQEDFSADASVNDNDLDLLDEENQQQDQEEQIDTNGAVWNSNNTNGAEKNICKIEVTSQERDEQNNHHHQEEQQQQEEPDTNAWASPDDDKNPSNMEGENSSQEEQQVDHVEADPNIWVLPADKNVCTLEEIRRGQVINKKPPTMCPVMGCGKIINEAKAEPSPGTIASGLRTHVLFVHYATQHGRKVVKKRKALGWSKKRNQSPRKQLNHLLASRFNSLEHQTSSLAMSSGDDFRNDPLDLKQQTTTSTSDLLANLQRNMAAALTPADTGSAPGSLLDKKIKQIAANKSLQVLQMSSHQSLMQAGGQNSSSSAGLKSTNNAQGLKNLNTSNNSKQNNNNNNNNNINNNNNFNSTTSSLFSILAGLTAQQQKNPHQPSLPRNVKTAHGTNTINISQCSKNPMTNNGTSTTNNRTNNSSLLSLLNEKISGNVASSLQNQLKKSLAEQRLKATTPRLSTSPALTTNSSYYQTNNNESNGNGASLLNNICSTAGVSSLNEDNNAFDTSMPLNTFVDMIAMRTGSNIGQSGVAEVKKFIEKFTTALICSSQTVADHYIAPYGEAPQQKPEISPSDVILAYKMMNRSLGQL